jgi:hypothetical protein
MKFQFGQNWRESSSTIRTILEHVYFVQVHLALTFDTRTLECRILIKFFEPFRRLQRPLPSDIPSIRTYMYIDVQMSTRTQRQTASQNQLLSAISWARNLWLHQNLQIVHEHEASRFIPYTRKWANARAWRSHSALVMYDRIRKNIILVYYNPKRSPIRGRFRKYIMNMWSRKSFIVCTMKWRTWFELWNAFWAYACPFKLIYYLRLCIAW